jgi:hypothetical protein
MKSRKQKSLNENETVATSLENVLKVMYDSAIDLQEMQSDFKGPIARIAVMGMSADISKLLGRFRNIARAIKTGDEANIAKVIQQESKKLRLRKIINEFIVDELKDYK